MGNKRPASGYEGLASAIVVQAAQDYRNGNQSKKDLEVFFESSWCDLLSRGTGKYILRKLKH